VSDPVRSTGGYHVLVLVDREAGVTPPLPEIEDQVRAEWQRRHGEDALRAQLAALRARASVEVTAEP
jgi:parvulin-like peptidyl-prolyl isomerase